jgi:outer membrane protein OmpA-like peptidoglycan-associated protein
MRPHALQLGAVVATLALTGCGGGKALSAAVATSSPVAASSAPPAATTTPSEAPSVNLQNCVQVSEDLDKALTSFAGITNAAQLAQSYAQLRSRFDADSSGLSAQARAAVDNYLTVLSKFITDEEHQDTSAFAADEQQIATAAEGLATACGAA